MTAHIEKCYGVKVAVAADNSAMLAFDGKDEIKIVIDMPQDKAVELTTALLAAGFGPNRVGRA